MGDAAREIQQGIDRIQVPSGYRITQGGAAATQNDATRQIVMALILSVLLMYTLMAALFESLIYP